MFEFLKDLDIETARAKLETMGISIDEWTEEQEQSLANFYEAILLCVSAINLKLHNHNPSSSGHLLPYRIVSTRME